MVSPRAIIVTGAVSISLPAHLTLAPSSSRAALTLRQNRGIGKAICKAILERHRASQLKEARPLTLFATSRAGFELSRSLTLGHDVQIVYPKLDVSDRDSIKALVDDVNRKHGASVDVLINNAGVNLDLDPKHGYGYENARKTLEVNYWGTTWVRRHWVFFQWIP